MLNVKMNAEDSMSKEFKRKTNSTRKSSKQIKKRKTIVAEEDCFNENNTSYLDKGAEELSSPKINCKDDVEDTWSTEDHNELIKRIEEQIPKDDKISFGARIARIDWKQVQFGRYSDEDCFGRWKCLSGNVRHYRLLNEILQDVKTWVQNPWTDKKRKGRHPDQPVRPLSSFMLYYMEKKEKVMARHPDLKLTEVSKIIGKKYKALSEEKKAIYIRKASLMQEEYKQNLLKFYEKHPEQVRTNKRTTIKSNKPLPPFKLFLKEKMERHEPNKELNHQELTEKYKKLWKTLSLKKKAYWIRMAKEQEEKFLEQTSEEPPDGPDDKSNAPYKSVVSKEESAILDRLAGKPEKPPNSAYSLFSRLMLQGKDEHFLESEPKDRMKVIANMWKEVPEDKKKEYAEEVKHMQEHYKLEFANYLESLPEERKAEELAKVQPRKKLKQRSKKKISRNSFPKENLFKNEPKKPPVSPLDVFKTQFLKKNSHLSISMACSQAEKMWKGLSGKETEKYKRKHQQLKEKYLAEYAAFLRSLSPEELREYDTLKRNESAAENVNKDSPEEGSNSEEDEDDSAGSNFSEEIDSGVSEED